MSKESSSLYAFTLIELLIVTGIMGILVAVSLPNFAQFSDRRLLERNVRNVEMEINSLRAKSISGVTGGAANYYAQWGINILCTGSNNQYQLGYMLDTDEDGVYDDGTSYPVTRTLAGNVAFDCGASDTTMFFTRFDGYFSDGSDEKSITVTSTADSKIINVYKSGKIEIE